MNKTPEQIAEEMYPKGSWTQYQRDVFLTGYHSRDSEIEKLVEALRDIFESADDGRYVSDKAKEALKPYITKTEIE